MSVTQRDLVDNLAKEVAKFPQLDPTTYHYFADGMYCRVLPMKAGDLIIGKTHKREHFYMVVQGAIRITMDEKVRDLLAPSILVSKPGTRRALFAIVDSVCLTVHRTDKTDLAEIEEELIEASPDALFGPDNKLLENF